MRHDFLYAAISSSKKRGAPSAGSEWLLDPSYLQAGHAGVDSGRGIENVSGGSNYMWTVPTVNTLPNSSEHIYFEVHAGPGGASNYNGYVALLDRRDVGEVGNYNPVTLNHVGWRGLGEVRYTGLAATGITDLRYGSEADRGVLRIIVKPSDDRMWFGVDDLFYDRIAPGGAFAVTSTGDLDASNATATRSPVQGRRIGLQVRGTGDRLTLKSREEDFLKPMPTGCVALATIESDLPFGSW